jgi:hypothetical protein
MRGERHSLHRPAPGPKGESRAKGARGAAIIRQFVDSGDCDRQWVLPYRLRYQVASEPLYVQNCEELLCGRHSIGCWAGSGFCRFPLSSAS